MELDWIRVHKGFIHVGDMPIAKLVEFELLNSWSR